ncbi:MFS transporter [Actinomadura craniellae]|uniref:MFS transporter n=1 Tax=Actinomadura craniellae TaxID=2231787 RepID=A0A365H1E1_9ACTN|nr:MFS transporter [Actinomadura craniellae]RAY12915.1 MFS transporter [Actinomadura craniellae]
MASAAPRAGTREWIGLAVLALPTILLALDFTVLHLALPQLSADLGPSSTQQLWILDVYGFMIAGFLITMGTLGDRIGRRRLLMIGAAAFGLASVAAAYASDPAMLIATRALLGVAGATLMPSTLALITNMFLDPRQRGFAVAVWLSCFSAGGAVGPLIGGVVLEWFWWGAVFLMGVPVMVLLLVAAPFLLPEYRDPRPGRLDLFSVALSLATILPAIWAFKKAAEDGWSAAVLVALAAGAVFGWVFVRRQRTLTSPLMDLGLFRFRAFSIGLGALLLGTLTLGAFVLLFAQYLQLVLELSPARAGLWMAPYALANIAGAMVAPVLTARISKPRVIAGGLLVAAAGYGVFSLVGVETGLLPAVLGSVLITVGLSPLMVLVIDLVISSAPKEKSGSASSLSETCSELGMALGVATLGAVGTAVYRHTVTGDLPSGLPDELRTAARDSLASAAAAAEPARNGAAAGALETAKDAFATGLVSVSLLSMAVVLVLAAVVALFLGPDGEAVPPEGDSAAEAAHGSPG